MSKHLLAGLSVLTVMFWFATDADAASKKPTPAKEPSAHARSSAPKAGTKPAQRGAIVKSKSNISNN